jgi:hypothetical protein
MLVLLRNAIPGAPPKHSPVGSTDRPVSELSVGLCCWLLLSLIPVNRSSEGNTQSRCMCRYRVEEYILICCV